MARSNFDTSTFWEEQRFFIRARIIRRSRARRNRPEAEEVMGHIYEALKRRRPDGIVDGDNPNAYLSRTIAAECLKCLRCELTPNRRIAGKELIPIEATEEPESRATETILQAIIDNEASETLRNAIDSLPEDEREIILSYFGLDGPTLTLANISKKKGVSIPTIAKRRDGALEKLRIKFVRHAS